MRREDRPVPYELDQFRDAQEGAYAGVLKELRAGRKAGHWIWFIFPQIAGLGSSSMSRIYSIVSLDEARAYLADPVLGARLRECASFIVSSKARTADEILGSLDALKLRSSMTLFLRAAPDEPLFQQVLDRYCRGIPDAATDAILGGLT